MSRLFLQELPSPLNKEYAWPSDSRRQQYENRQFACSSCRILLAMRSGGIASSRGLALGLPKNGQGKMFTSLCKLQQGGKVRQSAFHQQASVRHGAHDLQEISRAKALEDQTWEALQKRIPPSLREKCDAIHQRGPAPPPPGNHNASSLPPALLSALLFAHSLTVACLIECHTRSKADQGQEGRQHAKQCWYLVSSILDGPPQSCMHA